MAMLTTGKVKEKSEELLKQQLPEQTSESKSSSRTTRRSWRKLFNHLLIHAVLTAGILFVAGPFIYMILTACKDLVESAADPPTFLPLTWVHGNVRQAGQDILNNFQTTWNVANFGRYFFNTIWISLLIVAGSTFTAILAAYAFARMKFFGKNILFGIFLATMMIPFEAIIIPELEMIHNFDTWGRGIANRLDQFPLHWDYSQNLRALLPGGWQDFATLGSSHGLWLSLFAWIDNYKSLTLPWMVSVFGIFFLRQFFLTLPQDIYDAAILDGCSEWTFLWRIAVPLARSPLAAKMLFTFLAAWNSLLWSILVTNDDSMRPVQYGLKYFTTEAGVEYNFLMVGALIVILPILVLYFFAQKQFIEGITATGIKG